MGLGLVTFACDEGAAPTVSPIDGGNRDGGAQDAGAQDASLSDATTPDRAPMDAGPPACRFDPETDLIDLGMDPPGVGHRVAMAPAPDGVVAVWARTAGGASNIVSGSIPSRGAIPAPEHVTDDPHISRNPGVARVGDGYLAAWVDNSQGPRGDKRFEIRARPLDSAGVPTAEPVTVTDNAAREDELALVGFGGGALLAWVEYDGTTSERTLRVVRLDPQGDALGAATPLQTGTALERPVIAAAGDLAVVAWVEGSRVALQPLDDTAAPSGSVQYADGQMNAAGTLGAALEYDGTEPTGGAVVFGVRVSTRPEVRWRDLDATGSVHGGEQPLTSATETAAEPSVAAFRGGFATAYRVLSDPERSVPAIRVAFTDDGGEVVHTIDMVDTSETGSGTTLAVGLDGHLAVGWSEVNGSVRTLRVARMRCGS